MVTALNSDQPMVTAYFVTCFYFVGYFVTCKKTSKRYEHLRGRDSWSCCTSTVCCFSAYCAFALCSASSVLAEPCDASELHIYLFLGWFSDQADPWTIALGLRIAFSRSESVQHVVPVWRHETPLTDIFVFFCQS